MRIKKAPGSSVSFCISESYGMLTFLSPQFSSAKVHLAINTILSDFSGYIMSTSVQLYSGNFKLQILKEL